jgi:excinuclease ABC subunit C
VLENKLHLPEKPGIYIFKNAAGKPLYIGKARNLKKRVAQYFQRKDNPQLLDLLRRAARLDYVVTANEQDALLLESNLVHEYMPPFNIRLKDDKSFPFIQVTLEANVPGVYYSRQVKPGNFAMGPMASAQKARDLIDVVTRLFRIRSCPDSIFKKGIPCLYFHIARCSAPCANRIDPALYRQQVSDAVEFLRGRKRKIMTRMAGMMRRFSRELDFERAQQVKDDLDLMGRFSPRSYISTRERSEWDVLVCHCLGHDSFFAYFSVVRGQVSKSEYFSLQTVDELAGEVMRNFILEFYRGRPLPGEVVVWPLPEQPELLERLLSGRTRRRVRIRTARQGRKKKVLDLARDNLLFFIQKNDYRSLALKLMDELQLSHFPARIEGADISHLGEKNRVGALVVFKNGRPEKRSYRSFIIRTAAAGDSEALKEVLSRHFRGGECAADLLLVDGGLPQLGAAMQVKKELALRMDVIALAKGEERVFLESGSSLVFAPGSAPRHLLQNIRDEAHRRAIGHHRRRRQKIPG